MPKFALLRQFSPEMTRAQLDGIALASMATLDSYVYRGGLEPATDDHGIRWIRSYWEPGGYFGLCLYEAPSLALLSVYQNLCNLPYLDGQEVVEMSGPLEGGETDGHSARVAVSFRLDDAGGNPEEQISRLTELGAASDAGLIRTYWSEKQHIATALFMTSDSGRFAEQVTPLAERKPAKIVEISPEEYR